MTSARWPMVQSWFFGIEQELARNTILELAYNGNHATPIVADYNQAFPNLPGKTLGVQARRPEQSFGAITWVSPARYSEYNGFRRAWNTGFHKGCIY